MWSSWIPCFDRATRVRSFVAPRTRSCRYFFFSFTGLAPVLVPVGSRKSARIGKDTCIFEIVAREGSKHTRNTAPLPFASIPSLASAEARKHMSMELSRGTSTVNFVTFLGFWDGSPLVVVPGHSRWSFDHRPFHIMSLHTPEEAIWCLLCYRLFYS